MKTAVISGSFDPITLGHVDIIRRASSIFDKVVVAIVANGDKNGGMFTPDQRLELAKSAVRGIPGVEVAVYGGLCSDLCEKYGADVIVRGVRGAADFDYEFSLAEIMKHFGKKIETVFMPASPSLAYLSSSYVREKLRFGCDLSDVADSETASLMKEFFEKNKLAE